MVLTHPGIKDGMFYFLSDPTSNGIYVFQFICAGLATFIALILCVCHFGRLYYVYKSSKIENEINPTKNSIHIQDIFPSKNDKNSLGILYYYIWSYHILTVLAVILSLFHLTSGIVWSKYMTINCGVSIYFCILSWNLIKFCVYGMGILRIFNTYHGSCFDYSNRIKIYLIVHMVSGITFNSVFLTYLSQTYEILDDTNGEFKWCQFGSNEIGTYVITFFEGSMNIILAVLFIKPAIVLSKNSDNKPES